MGCSYCVIPRAIGPLRSKPLEAILDEFAVGLQKGFTRFQLMGDNAGSYGLDIGTGMGDLLDRIMLECGDDFHLDLTDINPSYLPVVSEAVEELCSRGNLSSLYVPIQSANHRILKLMHRDYDMDVVGRTLTRIKRSAPRWFSLGTSLIVGFPSETLPELNETISFCRDVGFDWVWCHSFSARPETPAAALPGQISPAEMLRRGDLVRTRLRGRSLVTTADDTRGSRTCQG